MECPNRGQFMSFSVNHFFFIVANGVSDAIAYRLSWRLNVALIFQMEILALMQRINCRYKAIDKRLSSLSHRSRSQR